MTKTTKPADLIRRAAGDNEANRIISARLIELLQAAGYSVHEGEADDRPDLGMRAHWFTWAAPGMADCECGDGQASYFGAWLSAAEHWFSNAGIALDVTHAAHAPREAFARVVGMAESHLEDIESGIQDGTYDAAENDPGGDRRALDVVSAFLAGTNETDTPAPAVVVVMDGGLIQNIMSDAPVRVLVVDYDVEGTTDDVREVPQHGGGTAEGLISLRDAEHNPEEVAALVDFADEIESRERREAEAIACSFSGEARRTMGRRG